MFIIFGICLSFGLVLLLFFIYNVYRKQIKTNDDQISGYPKHWGTPPLVQTKDYVELPSPYGGFGSSSLRNWIRYHMTLDLDIDETKTISIYPKHWGTPPLVQTKDYVELPSPYGGFGSSSLRNWIRYHMTLDLDKTSTYPKHWGTPPLIQTADYVELPSPYGGFGSSSLRNWIRYHMTLDLDKTTKKH
jgi:hypothetical protein